MRGSSELFDESAVEAIVSFPHLTSPGGRGTLRGHPHKAPPHPSPLPSGSGDPMKVRRNIIASSIDDTTLPAAISTKTGSAPAPAWRDEALA